MSLFDKDCYVAIYKVIPDGTEWICWPSLAGSLDNCRELYQYWYGDLPVDLRKDRALLRIAKIHITEVEPNAADNLQRLRLH